MSIISATTTPRMEELVLSLERMKELGSWSLRLEMKVCLHSLDCKYLENVRCQVDVEISTADYEINY